jgi:chromosome segregation ATPase
VLKSIDLVNSSARNKDQQIDEVRRALQALKLRDLEVDVASTKLQLQQELSTLRTAVDNGGVNIAPPPPAVTNAVSVTAGPAVSLEKDLERIKTLEAENKLCRDQMKDFQTRLTAANDAITKANGNAAESAKMEIQSLKAEVEELKKTGAAKTAQLAEKDVTIAEHVKKLDALAKENQSKSAADSNKEQALKAEIDKAKAAVAQLEAKLAASTREWDAKFAGKSQELAALGESKARELQELEARLEGEKEEMMEAMAQEIEVGDCMLFRSWA